MSISGQICFGGVEESWAYNKIPKQEFNRPRRNNFFNGGSWRFDKIAGPGSIQLKFRQPESNALQIPGISIYIKDIHSGCREISTKCVQGFNR